MYIENPKTKGSGIICCIPQEGQCPINCPDCFFQSGRSYLEPLDKNLPNMPSLEEAEGRIVRVNDGNDSNNKQSYVISSTEKYKEKFYNTSIPKDLEKFPGPIVLTINPGSWTDNNFVMFQNIPSNLMYVRFRTNAWNIEILKQAVEFYTTRDISVVLTFMAYYSSDIPEDFKQFYSYNKRTLNEYYTIKKEKWDEIVELFRGNPLVFTCGKDYNIHPCKNCGNCLREYYKTKERMR
jgi:hypothetical protein